jgi:tetratricopeptide (TPR) repeat protein
LKRQQLILVSGGLLLFIALFFFGKTVPLRAKTEKPIQQAQSPQALTTEILLAEAKKHLPIQQQEKLLSLENSVIRGDVKEQQLHVYHQLARFWKDSAKIAELYAYYTGEAAKLDNSEKSLTFAAQLFIDNLLAANEPSFQNWLASNAKVLLDKALEINPANDSSKISLGACYILGGISDNPMTGILPVREIAQKNPDNLYAQLILGLGGKKSGQYDKAIERFTIIVTKQPNNLEAMLHLAECYDLKGEKKDAIKWYEAVKKIIPNVDAKKELDERINQLKS